MTARWLMIWTAGCALIIGVAACTLFVIHSALDTDQRATLLQLLDASATLLVPASILALAFTGLLAHWIARTYFTPLRRYADQIQIMAAGNPSHRIEASGSEELGGLARAINDFAERHQKAMHEVEARIDAANASLARERSQLAALMSDLAQCVVVCNAEGCILLYNEQARALFAASANSAAFLGLGRSIHSLLERDAVMNEYAGLRRRLLQGEIRPISEFDATLYDGRTVHARMAPVSYEAGDACPEGFVLLLSELRPAAATVIAPAPALPGRPVYYDFDLFSQAGQTREIDERPLSKLAYTVFDTETTGLDPGAGDEIISIGAVRIVNGRLLTGETFHQLIDPRRPLHPDSVRVHGITAPMLAGKPVIDAVLPAFHRFCEGTVLVGHNAAFDMRFLQLKESSSGVKFTAPVLDTLLLSAVLHGNALEHRLDGIAMRLGVDATDRHTALGDAVTTARVFLKLLPLLEAHGIRTLKEARTASARTVHARIRY